MTDERVVITYVELPAPNLDPTKAFYSAAFGWSWIDYGPTYAASEDAGIEVGLNATGTPAPAHAPGDEDGIGPLLLLSTADLAATLARIVDAGGVIVSDPYPYPGGNRFHAQDPSGNILGVYQSS